MKKLLAVVLTLAMVLAFAACGAKTEEESTTAPEETSEDIIEETSEDVSEDASEAVSEDASEAVSEDASEAASEDASEAASEDASEGESTEVAKAPETKAEILAAYNNAINGAYAAKAGFSKERYTDNENMDMSLALKAFKSLVEQFVGIGEDNKYSETVTKGQWDEDTRREYLRKSTLTESDLTGATCKEDGKYYVITLNVKPGTSKGSEDEKYTKAPIDKCGICVGNEDKGYYDHKTGEVIYDAIGGTYAGAKIDESYSNAKAVAKIDKTTGKLVALTVTYDISVAIDIGIGSGTATGTAHILYKNFTY